MSPEAIHGHGRVTIYMSVHIGRNFEKRPTWNWKLCVRGSNHVLSARVDQSQMNTRYDLYWFELFKE
jgi:hypothetical protein